MVRTWCVLAATAILAGCATSDDPERGAAFREALAGIMGGVIAAKGGTPPPNPYSSTREASTPAPSYTPPPQPTYSQPSYTPPPAVSAPQPSISIAGTSGAERRSAGDDGGSGFSPSQCPRGSGIEGRRAYDRCVCTGMKDVFRDAGSRGWPCLARNGGSPLWGCGISDGNRLSCTQR